MTLSFNQPQRKLYPGCYRCSNDTPHKPSLPRSRTGRKPICGGLFGARVECAVPERYGKSLSEAGFVFQGWGLADLTPNPECEHNQGVIAVPLGSELELLSLGGPCFEQGQPWWA